MAENIESLVLEHLRHMRGSLDRIEGDVGDLKLRLSSVEEHLGQQQVQLAGINRRFDRLEERVGRIERRLDLTDAPAA